MKRADVDGTASTFQWQTAWRLAPPPSKVLNSAIALINKRLIVLEEAVPDLRLLGDICPACTVHEAIGTPQDLAERGSFRREPTPRVHVPFEVSLTRVCEGKAVKPFLGKEQLLLVADLGRTKLERISLKVDEPKSWAKAT